MANVNSVVSRVTKAIKDNGISIKVDSGGKKTSTYGVWTEGTNSSDDDGDMLITKDTRKIITPFLSTIPEVGGFIIVGKDTFSIDEIEVYRMEDTDVAYQMSISK
jgi:hypothetical protein